MKNIAGHFSTIIAVCILLNPLARAEDQTREQAIALLTSGVWHFQGSNWNNDRAFQKNGTVLVRASNANGTVRWRMDSKQVTIVFEDHEDVLYLPIDPKGTKGTDAHDNDFVAMQVPGSASAAASGPPSALDALKPLAGGSTPAPGADQSPAGITALLTSKEWWFDGANWSETRVFRADGLMTIDNDARTAHWQIAGDKIVITFKDHKDVLFLPLDPKGTKGQGGYGRLFIATQVTEGAPAPGTAASSQKPAPGAPPGSGAAYFGSTNAYGGSPSPTPAPMPGAPP